jgi:class 3 adenylate cyclase/HAMP domain-containing protein
MVKPRSFAAMGVRGRLLLAFLGICMFALVAAGSGFFSLSQVGSALNIITEQRVPQAISWLELSRQTERVVRAAPAMLLVNTENERSDVSEKIALQAAKVDSILEHIRTFSPEKRDLKEVQISALVRRLNGNIESLDLRIKERLSISAQKAKSIRKLGQANKAALRALSPGARVLGSQIVEWNRGTNTEGGLIRKLDEQVALAGSIIGLIPQQRAAVLIDSLHNNLLNISTAGTAENVDVLIFPLTNSLNELSEIAKGFPERVKRRLAKQIKLYEDLAVGPESLSQIRKDELAIIAEAEELLATNVQLSNFLTDKINVLVQGANTEIVESNLQAAAVQKFNSNVLIGVVVLSLVSSFLIVWLYVGRNLVARLTALSDSMLAIAGGNLRASLPAPGGGDEIGRMAEALVVFRDTAIEVEESNLREIEEARRRLVDAIENSSDGFAFYDAQDRLVICNTVYRNLLSPDADIEIEPGMAFEAVIRLAVESGHIADAEGRIDEWVADHLALHRDPGEPIIQRHSSGQWVLITERRTGDGGTVTIYSDITDLKQREEDLTKKSNALEQLSNQLAKYLSPQVYDSIFSGKQEVKLVSQRKRLTVFFSDLVGFTETTERLESEDLNRLLNHYLTEMSQIAIAHGATIDKYVGDAIVIFFGDPETRGVKEDALACVTMAIAMRKRMKELEDVWMEAGLEEPLQCRMGINTGVCTVGNFGSEDRMDYTIIGGGVNLASRLETACPANQILISYETYAHVKDQIECQEAGQIEVKGISHPITTHRVIDLYENLGEGKQPIRAKMPHVRLDVDVDLMTANEKREAAAMLLEAAERLSNIDAKA